MQQQFFPSSDRPELLVDLTLPQGSPIINATSKVVDDFEKLLKGDPDIQYWSFYIGQGAIRFYLLARQRFLRASRRYSKGLPSPRRWFLSSGFSFSGVS